MKAIKDCEWRVRLEICLNGPYYWSANPKQELGVRHRCGKDFVSKANFKSEYGAKRNWEKFAKINKIKKWRYV